MAQPQSLAPPLAEVELPARNVRALLERNATDPDTRDRAALRFGDRTWTHAEVLDESQRFAALLAANLDPSRPPHVGVLLDNTPDYVFTLYGAGLLGAVVVGLNTTRRDEHLAADITHTDVQLLLTEPRHLPLLATVLPQLDLPGGLIVSDRFPDDGDPTTVGRPLTAALTAAPAVDLPDPDARVLWTLLFTSGTAGAPKAVRCTQHRLLTTGSRMSMMLELGHDDVGYAAMPLFHTNSLMAGLAAALVAGATLSMTRRFSASQFLPDVRRYGVTWFNYTGKLLAYLLAVPEQADDADTTLRIAFGNEGSPQVVAAAAARFGTRIVDVFGSTEGSIALDRTGGPPPGSVGRLRQGIAVVDPDGNDKEPARFDADGRLLNPEECIGELVNKLGVGPFEGYYNNAEATERTTAHGWYWSGDLAYVDADAWVFFAGRTGDWLRVDGENFAAGPVEAIISRHPDVLLAAVYGVPDADAGDQVMTALVLRDGMRFDGAAFARWVDAQADLSPKWRPRYVRVATALPVTPTNKVITRMLVHDKVRADRTAGDALYVRRRGAEAFVPFTDDDEAALRAAFEAAGRSRLWDL
ncbi:MAG TPA: AMP-binding protein [Mycobacteriales bacterium]|nr:AMP-binding protein [Mycobacteriales bacterium]